MKQNLLIALAMLTLCCFASPTFALDPPPFQWQQNHGWYYPDQFLGITQLPDGGYLMCGTFGLGPAEYHDACLVLADAAGNYLNGLLYQGGDYNDWLNCALPTGDGGYLSAGTFMVDAVNSQMWLVKVNSGLAVEWQEDYGGSGSEGCNSFLATQGGGYLLYGSSNSFGSDVDGYVVKVDANGVFDWQAVYSDVGDDAISSVIQLADGSYRMYGPTHSFGAADVRTRLIHTDESGNVLHEYYYGGACDHVSYQISLAPDAGFYLTGTTESFGSGARDMWLLHVAADGDSLWSRTWGAGNWEECRASIADYSGGCVMAGYQVNGLTGDTQGALVKFDALGNQLWELTLGGDGSDDWYALCQTSDLGYALSGGTGSLGRPEGDMWQVKFGDDLPSSTIAFEGTQPPNPYVSRCVHLEYGVIYELELRLCPSYDAEDIWFFSSTAGCLSDPFGMGACNEPCDPAGDLIFGPQRIETTPVRRLVQPVWLAQGATEGCACITLEIPLDGRWTGDCWLPIELAAFEAIPREDHILIRFATASESDNDHFEIMRGEIPDGEFARIAQLPSLGNSSWEQTYEFRDYDVVPGQAYWYYLVDVDLDGSREEHLNVMTSASLPLQAVPFEYALAQNFPNPFNSTTEIIYSLPEDARVVLTVYNVSGQLIARLVDGVVQAGEHHVKFDAAGLASGVYLYSLDTEATNLTRKMLFIK